MAIEQSKDLVSIIMPAYNAEAFINEAIESVVLQTYPYWELIITNDGSTDSTLSIIEEWIKKDSRIKVITQANQGETASRNTALNTTKGKYISFLDSDDFYFPTFLEKMVKKIANVECDSVYCGFIHEGDNTIVGTPYAEGNILECMAIENQRICIIAFMIKKSFIDTHNLQFIKGIKIGGDIDFIMRYGMNGNTVAVTEPLSFYRRNASSITKNTNTSNLEKIKLELVFRDNINNYLAKHYQNANKTKVLDFFKLKRDERYFSGERDLWKSLKQGHFDLVLNTIKEYGNVKNCAVKHKLKSAIRLLIINSCCIPLWKLISNLYNFSKKFNSKQDTAS